LQAGLPAGNTISNFSLMAGIYIHIPFCRQACHYCNFHFTTSLRYKNELVAALLKETELQKNYLAGEVVETVYFGGGTPSLCTKHEIRSMMEKIRSVFSVSPAAEITLEANPDDITEEKLTGWQETGINRLSIGVQSFFEEDLKWMNRAHNAQQALNNLQWAIRQFDNITLDLIYGHPLLSDEKWKQNMEKVISLNIPHLSCYALTVEPKTPLQKLINEHKKEDVDQSKQSEHFLQLMSRMKEAGYEHYEISNFARPGFRSRHNSSYWSTGPCGQGKKYLGLGPSAHSYNGTSRQWNISNNSVYISSLGKNEIPFEKEVLTPTQQVNEYIMTSLRTMEGLDLKIVGSSESRACLPDRQVQSRDIRSRSQKFIDAGKMILKNNRLILTDEGKLFADGIAAELFFD
jgi:oxygen-independent coproporphyrinogen-3 oxidase